MAGFDFNLFQQLNAKQDNGGGGDGMANQVETPELIVKATNSWPGKIAKVAEAIPIIGPLLSRIIPVNAGEVSAFAPFERKSWTEKSINEGAASLTARGGVAYNSTMGALAANKAIQNHASDVVSTDIASLVGQGSYGNYSFSDMPAGTNVSPIGPGGGGGNIELG